MHHHMDPILNTGCKDHPFNLSAPFSLLFKLFNSSRLNNWCVQQHLQAMRRYYYRSFSGEIQPSYPFWYCFGPARGHSRPRPISAFKRVETGAYLIFTVDPHKSFNHSSIILVTSRTVLLSAVTDRSIIAVTPYWNINGEVPALRIQPVRASTVPAVALSPAFVKYLYTDHLRSTEY